MAAASAASPTFLCSLDIISKKGTSPLKIRPTILPAPLLRLKAQLSGNSPIQPYIGDEPPLRSELFSAEQMEQHGKTLARLHALSARHEPDPLLNRLAENEVVLLDVQNLVAEAVKGSRRITPAGEWLLDRTVSTQLCLQAEQWRGEDRRADLQR